MKVIICGGRDFKDVDRFYESMLNFVKFYGPINLVISGHAQGADQLGEMWADEFGVSLSIYPADWDRYGRRAGYLRNIEMADCRPDFVIAFPGGKGTELMKKIARNRGIPIYEG